MLTWLIKNTVSFIRRQHELSLLSYFRSGWWCSDDVGCACVWISSRQRIPETRLPGMLWGLNSTRIAHTCPAIVWSALALSQQKPGLSWWLVTAAVLVPGREEIERRNGVTRIKSETPSNGMDGKKAAHSESSFPDAFRGGKSAYLLKGLRLITTVKKLDPGPFCSQMFSVYDVISASLSCWKPKKCQKSEEMLKNEEEPTTE